MNMKYILLIEPVRMSNYYDETVDGRKFGLLAQTHPEDCVEKTRIEKPS